MFQQKFNIPDLKASTLAVDANRRIIVADSASRCIHVVSLDTGEWRNFNFKAWEPSIVLQTILLLTFKSNGLFQILVIFLKVLISYWLVTKITLSLRMAVKIVPYITCDSPIKWKYFVISRFTKYLVCRLLFTQQIIHESREIRFFFHASRIRKKPNDVSSKRYRIR